MGRVFGCIWMDPRTRIISRSKHVDLVNVVNKRLLKSSFEEIVGIFWIPELQYPVEIFCDADPVPGVFLPRLPTPGRMPSFARFMPPLIAVAIGVALRIEPS